MWPDYDLQPQVPAGHWHRGRSPLKHWALQGGKCACSRLQVPGPAQWNWEVTNEHYTSVTLGGLLATDKRVLSIHPFPRHSTDFHETCHCGPAVKEMLSFYSKTNKMHNISILLYFGITLYMFRTVFPSIIRNLRLYIQHQVYVIQVLWLLASGTEMELMSNEWVLWLYQISLT